MELRLLRETLVWIFLIHYMEISTETLYLRFYFKFIQINYIEVICSNHNQVFISANIFTCEEFLYI